MHPRKGLNQLYNIESFLCRGVQETGGLIIAHFYLYILEKLEVLEKLTVYGQSILISEVNSKKMALG